jgi:hypothetical protein
MDLRLRAQKAMTPRKGEGYNVVGVDSFEEPGDELYLIGNYSTQEEAERVAALRRRQHPDTVHVYAPSDDAEKSLVRGDLRKHVGEQLVYTTPASRKIDLEW